MLLNDLQTDEGYHARAASDGLEARQHCEQQLPQLITDLHT